MATSSKNIYIAGSIFVIILTIALMYSMFRHSKKDQEMEEMIEVMNFEKEQLEDEFAEFTTQFDGYGVTIKNDSLFHLLDQEKTKVNQLLSELRTTKATNARRISELKKELATVRSVMVQYVHQIDSLDRMNKKLVTENREVKQKYREVTQQAELLEQEKEVLTQVVSRASMLEITNFEYTKLNSRDRRTSRYSQIAKLQFDYSISKNITVNPGIKSVYMRIIRPDGEVMTKSDTHVFPFENREIPYSIAKTFEYQGDELSDVVYWKVEEILQKGNYTVEFFIDGNNIGNFDFEIK